MDFTLTLQTLAILNAIEVLEKIVKAAEENKDEDARAAALVHLDYAKRGLAGASLQNGIN